MSSIEFRNTNFRKLEGCHFGQMKHVKDVMVGCTYSGTVSLLYGPNSQVEEAYWAVIDIGCKSRSRVGDPCEKY